MARLPKFTLSYEDNKDRWALTNDKTDRVIKTFPIKSDAVKGGILEKTVGSNGGSVKIQLKNGRFEEERTYPGTKDPESSKG